MINPVSSTEKLTQFHLRGNTDDIMIEPGKITITRGPTVQTWYEGGTVTTSHDGEISNYTLNK